MPTTCLNNLAILISSNGEENAYFDFQMGERMLS